ncbi:MULTISPECIES: hypothetical protein [Nostoc]|jgi:hypothetical protein|uniref:Uncharacterized protein n=1 Tax=Nostoc commune NIES-4072 TaxID=2005467 RepID=A0A2R5FFB8_NOSCO|nr:MULTISPECIES: hypothetical protein [Nostoc]MBN3922412.1 hypothetical protein [Nostoc sp. NMS4]MDZ7970361.1 hypothetical protein [Nostoc sp. DedSLP03]BBD65469.1 hypothetical protein NIES4070_18270 [Nostoc commune HK-02]GBG17207.1 hypothetical protein NIES4072_08560 [Nostoc commune NIES-4072]
MSEKKELRGYVSPELNRLFRAVVALKDKNLSDTIAEALEDWLNKPENQELIKKHNLGK